MQKLLYLDAKTKRPACALLQVVPHFGDYQGSSDLTPFGADLWITFPDQRYTFVPFRFNMDEWNQIEKAVRNSQSVPDFFQEKAEDYVTLFEQMAKDERINEKQLATLNKMIEGLRSPETDAKG